MKICLTDRNIGFSCQIYLYRYLVSRLLRGDLRSLVLINISPYYDVLIKDNVFQETRLRNLTVRWLKKISTGITVAGALSDTRGP